MNLSHLRAEVHELASLSGPERLARLPANRWIGYTRANQAIALLERLLAREPGRVRPRNLLVVGPTNNGKTASVEHFVRAHRQHAADDGEREVIPVLLVQMPASPTIDRLYAAILVGVGVPGAMYGDRRPGRAWRCVCSARWAAACWCWTSCKICWPPLLRASASC